ncbi:unnamed protein product, partial [Prorocentrum cordatum]
MHLQEMGTFSGSGFPGPASWIRGLGCSWRRSAAEGPWYSRPPAAARAQACFALLGLGWSLEGRREGAKVPSSAAVADVLLHSPAAWPTFAASLRLAALRPLARDGDPQRGARVSSRLRGGRGRGAMSAVNATSCELRAPPRPEAPRGPVGRGLLPKHRSAESRTQRE